MTGLNARALPHLEPVPFFRSPRSEFPSGHASLETLAKSFSSQKIQNQIVVQRKTQGHQRAFLKDSEVLTAKNLLSFESPLHPQELRQVLTATPLTETRLRQQAHWRSEPLAKIQPFDKIRILSLGSSNWVLVENEQHRGYVDINELALKTDFASHVLLADKAWHPVAHRDGLNLILAQTKQKVPLSDVLAVLPRMNEGVSLVEKSFLKRNERVDILSSQPEEWLTSQLRGHGEVFWKRPQTSSPTNPLFNTEELLKRSIYSIAQNPKNPGQFLVSSNGVFMTLDGKNWQEFPAFKDENLPVAFGPANEIYVGSHRSLDQGKSFRPYLRWPDLIQVIHRESRLKPTSLKISGIEFLGQDLIKIKIATEERNFRLIAKRTPQLIQRWELQ